MGLMLSCVLSCLHNVLLGNPRELSLIAHFADSGIQIVAMSMLSALFGRLIIQRCSSVTSVLRHFEVHRNGASSDNIAISSRQLFHTSTPNKESTRSSSISFLHP